MREAVVVASSRTPLAKSFRGSFNMTRPDDLLAHCLSDVLGKVPELDPAEVEDIIAGCATPERAAGSNVARVAAVRAGLPVTIAATTVNRFCSSGLQAVAMAANQIIVNGADVAIGLRRREHHLQRRRAGHAESVDHRAQARALHGHGRHRRSGREALRRDPRDAGRVLADEPAAHGGRPAGGLLRRGAGADARHLRHHRQGDEEDRPHREKTVERDECNRPDTTLQGLSNLQPYFDPDSGKGSVTAGNASQLSDGASATLLMSRERADQLGVKAKVVFRGFAVAGCEPDEMGIGPVFAIPRLLERHDLKVDDVDLWELNEAFASQVVYCRDRLGIDQEKLNVNGGSIAIGHPFGMTGSRMVGHLANEMQRRQARYGVVTMCIGGGQGAAGLFELA